MLNIEQEATNRIYEHGNI